MQDEIGISTYDQRSALKMLIKQWFVTVKKAGMPAKYHYTIEDLPVLQFLKDKCYNIWSTSATEFEGQVLQNSEDIDKNTNSKKENKKEITDSSVFDLKIWFDLFWDAYPNKKATGKARESYIKVIWKKDQQAMHDKIMQWLEYYIDEIKALATKKEYIAHATTWLNQQRWQDEYRWPLYIKHHKHINKPLKPFTPITMDDNDNNNPNTNTSIDGATNTWSAIQEHASTTRSSGGGLWSIFGELQRSEMEFDTEHQHL